VVTSIVAVAVVWRYILQPDGLLNTALALIGIHGPDWLNDTTWALPSLIAMAVWRNVGTLMVIFLAGLQAVPTDVKEAAMMDGASPWRRSPRSPCRCCARRSCSGPCSSRWASCSSSRRPSS
jgi:multiple sugar transport system permease protein